MTDAKIVCHVPTAKPIFESWLARGDGIGVFRNEALDSAACGHLVFLPAKPADRLVVGQSRAPDSVQYGPGWKYVLQRVVTSIDDITFEALPPEPPPKPKRVRKR